MAPTYCNFSRCRTHHYKINRGVWVSFSRNLSVLASRRNIYAGELSTTELNSQGRPPDQTALGKGNEFKRLLDSLPLIRSLRSVASTNGPERLPSIYKELHMHSNIHPTAISTHLFPGSLLGEHKFPFYPYLYIRTQPTCQVILACYIGSHLTGHPGYIHGGIPFILFDDIFARIAGTTFKSGVGMTANMSLDFRKPSIPDRVYIIRAEVAKLEGRKAWVTGNMRLLRPFGPDEMANRANAVGDQLSVEEEEGDIVVEAKALFMEPKFATSMVSLFQNESPEPI